MGGEIINKILNLLIIFTLAVFCISAVSASDIDKNDTELSTDIDISHYDKDILKVSYNDEIISEGEITISDRNYPNQDTINRDVGSVTLDYTPYIFSSENDIVNLTINGYSQAVAYSSSAKANGITFSFTEPGRYTVFASSGSIFGTVTSNTLTYIIGGGSTDPVIDTNKTYQTKLALFDSETSSTVIYKNLGDSAAILNNLSNSELGSTISSLISKINKEGQTAINEYIDVYLNGEMLGRILVSPNGDWANGANLAFTEPGWYNFTAFYAGNEYLSNATSNVLSYYVAEADENITEITTTQINVDNKNITLGESAIITPTVFDSKNQEITSGYVDIYVDGSKVSTIKIGDSYTLTPSSTGNVDVYAEFLADASHKSSKSNTERITVNENSTEPVKPVQAVDTKTTVRLNQSKINYGNKVLITPTVVDKSNNPVKSGRIAISVSDMNMTTIDVGQSYEFYPFLPANYEIKAYYIGNDEYKASSSSVVTLEVVFGDDPIDDNTTDDNTTDNPTEDNTTDENVTGDTVLDTITKVSVNPSEVISGEEVTITPNVADINGNTVKEGNVQIYIDDNLITSINVGNNYKIALTEKGSYKVHARYLGNENYNPSTSDKVKFKVKEDNSKNDTPVTPVNPKNDTPVTPVNPTNDTPVTPVNPTNDTPVTPANNTNVTPVTPTNNTNVTPVTPTNDTNITPANETTLIKVKLVADNLEMFYHDGSRFYVKLTDEDGNPISGQKISIDLNGMSYSRTTNDKGEASIAVSLNSAVYPVKLTYAGSDKYNNCSAESQINVKPTVIAHDVTKIFRNGTNYEAVFLDNKGNVAPNTKVQFNIHGVFYNRTTNSEGYARLNLNLEQGTYIITAYNPITGEQYATNVTILPTITDNKDVTKYYRNASSYKVRLWGYDGKVAKQGTAVQFNINGVFYTRYADSNGWANLNLNLEPGEYVITAEYNDCKVSNTIKILPTIKADDLKMSYRDGSKFNVTILDGQGNPYSNQVVSCNVNGVFYNRTTDSNGVASLNINLQSGEYIITSSFNGLNKSNKITIA